MVTVLFGLLFAGRAFTQPPAVSTATVPSGPALRLLAPAEYPDFHESFQSKGGLIKAAKKALAYLEGPSAPRLVKLADRDYGAGELAASLEAVIALAKTAATQDEFADAIKEGFDVFASNGSDGAGKVIFSSYYQPSLAASRKKTPKYFVPLYKRPADMVDVDLGDFDKSLAGRSFEGRVDKKTRNLVPYFSRGEIDVKKALAGKGLELAWLKDKYDVLDLHIQGSGILRFPDGKEMLAKFAATNGQPYNSVGRLLIAANVFTKDNITRDKIRDYLHEHPEAEDWLLEQDPRYTFFDLAPLPADGEPFGALNQSLVPARSIAIDPALFPLGALAFFTTTAPQADKEGRLLGLFPSSRFAVCMDTGGAIKGPGRVDIYAGHGKQAETTARNQWSDGRLYFLVKKLPPRER
jgi:membrane-bound lytic murein transglycosylase A